MFKYEYDFTRTLFGTMFVITIIWRTMLVLWILWLSKWQFTVMVELSLLVHALIVTGDGFSKLACIIINSHCTVLVFFKMIHVECHVIGNENFEFGSWCPRWFVPQMGINLSKGLVFIDAHWKTYLLRVLYAQKAVNIGVWEFFMIILSSMISYYISHGI